MQIQALLNTTNIHNSPCVERFYRLNTSIQRRPSQPSFKTYSKVLTRDEKLEIRTLRRHNKWSYITIAKATGKTVRQVQDALGGPLTPRRRQAGRKPLIRTPEKRRLEQLLLSDPLYRRLPFQDLQYYLPDFETYGEHAIRTALRSLGYKRVVRPRRIRLTERHKAERLAFAYEQLSLRPRPEDWEKVLFSDETWATNSHMWKQWITVHESEDPNAWALLREKPHGWMFWGTFAGGEKGPGFVWEKEYGGINAEKYQRYIVPLVHGFLEPREGYVFQQDNASSHRAITTKRLLGALGIEFLVWPAKSPDLSPIENVWFWMKDWLEKNYDIESLNLPRLYAAVEEAWEAVPEDFLKQLAHSMPGRLRKVIANGGGRIDY